MTGRNPKNPNNDHLIFSKGHACPLLYSMFKAAGAITDEELLTLRQFGSRLEGHPNPHVTPYTDVATGSLGQGLPIGVGMALDGKYLDKLPFKVWVVLGDSRSGRRLHLGGRGQGQPLQAEQSDRHSGHEPAGPARRNRSGLEQRRLCRPRPRVRRSCH